LNPTVLSTSALLASVLVLKNKIEKVSTNRDETKRALEDSTVGFNTVRLG
jgi:hypothetical protein